MSLEGHNEPCYFCKRPCNSLHGNPGLWPIPLCHTDEPGVVKWHHTICVMERLQERENLIAELEKNQGFAHRWGQERDKLKVENLKLIETLSELEECNRQANIVAEQAKLGEVEQMKKCLQLEQQLNELQVAFNEVSKEPNGRYWQEMYRVASQRVKD